MHILLNFQPVVVILEELINFLVGESLTSQTLDPFARRSSDFHLIVPLIHHIIVIASGSFSFQRVFSWPFFLPYEPHVSGNLPIPPSPQLLVSVTILYGEGEFKSSEKTSFYQIDGSRDLRS
jgi:hypothetical protein